MGNNSLPYFIFLLWLCYLIASSILLFTKGFLLTRAVQKKNSTCLLHSEVPCSENGLYTRDQCSIDDKLSDILMNYQSASSICLPARTRVVLLIIDALRYDFTVYDDKIENPMPYQNKLPVISKILDENPSNSRLYKFIADPPTTTMQRLKALTTGSLPTFIDAGSNFATSEIEEDNIIDQLLRQKHGVVFMGDDTWNGLYANRFTRNFPYPSFNVWDLDTVDNGVKDNLYRELDNTDWSLLIGHFLGVDHCGHRYGPDHPEMERKLTEMDDVIRTVINKINGTDDLTLFVIGDHGMTVTGDHGGESKDEITAAMFVYSNQILNHQVSRDTVKQIDLVPTLSTLLGIPIPYQNLGTLIIDSIPIMKRDNTRFSLFSLWGNAQQMFSYIKEYSDKEGSFDEEILGSFQRKYSVLNSRVIGVDNDDKFETVSNEIVGFLRELRELCESVWIQFDSYAMIRGLLFIFLTTSFVFIISDGMQLNLLSKIFSSSFVYFSIIMLAVSVIISIIFYKIELIEELYKNIIFTTCFLSIILLALLVVQNWEDITNNWFSKQRNKDITNLIYRFILVFNIGGLFSNSYIIEESFVLLFLLITVILLGIFSVLSKYKKKTFKSIILASIFISILIRGSMYYWKCRSEQQWCFTLHLINTNITKSETTKTQFTVTVIFLGIFVFITKEWLRKAGNLNGYSLNVTQTKFLPTIIVVCSSIYWALIKLTSKSHSSLNNLNTLPLTVYILTTVGVLICVFKPIYAYVHQEYTTNSIPALYRRIKNNLDKNDVPIVYGMGTLYSPAFVTIGVYLTLLFALVLGDAVAPSAVIMFVAGGFMLLLDSVMRIEKIKNIDELFDVPNLSVLIWIILSQYFFYGTGHQPAFSNISWDAAFIGTSGIFKHNFIPATLVIINTFCSYILMGVLLPLVLITPFTLFIMIPSVCNKKSDSIRSEAARGEVILFEKDKLMMTSMFVLACKYIVGHAIRVFASMLAATIHCRHLMVWNIFAPKLIFESIGMFITLGSVLVGYLILVRINNQAEKMIQSLNKLN